MKLKLKNWTHLDDEWTNKHLSRRAYLILCWLIPLTGTAFLIWLYRDL